MWMLAVSIPVFMLLWAVYSYYDYKRYLRINRRLRDIGKNF